MTSRCSATIAFIGRKGRVIGAEIADPHHATLAGVRVGDSLEAVLQRLRGRYRKSSDDNGMPRLEIDSETGRNALVIESDGAKIIRLRAGETPFVLFAPRCL